MQKLLDRISDLRILVVGDLVLDHYIWGDADRISPEAPVPVISVDRDSYAAGAAANVALNLRSLGVSVDLCGALGKDDAGEKLRELLSSSGIGVVENLTDGLTPTIVKTRVVVRGQQLCRLDREGLPDQYSLNRKSLASILKARIETIDAIIISDYAKGVVTQNLIETVQTLAQRAGVVVAYDPKPKRRIHFKDLDLITPNRAESLLLAGLELIPHEPFPSETVCRMIWQKYRPKRLVVTLGGDGMLLCENGDMSEIIPTYAREVFDVSGAGDTVIAALTAAISSGASLIEAAHFANTAAGVVVGKLGTATATPEEVLAYEKFHEK